MKKISIIIISFLLLLGFWQIAQGTELLLDYPNIPNAQKPGETTNLPEIIKYIYLFALGAAGVVALLAILIGAIMYIFSAGNPSKASDAKDRILSALLGIIILLISVLLLRIINPDLINIGFILPEITKCFPADSCISDCERFCGMTTSYCSVPISTGICPNGKSVCHCE